MTRSRQQLAQKLWHDPYIIDRAKPYLPKLTFEKPATEEERAEFVVAIPDSRNRGVFDKNGNCTSPRFNHHVDNDMYADITKFMEQAVAASIISLYKIVGYPNDMFPDPISWEKFGSLDGHKGRVVGWEFNTRSLTYTLPADKRMSLQQLLGEWIPQESCSILEAATLNGTLADASRANRQGRTLFFGFQNALQKSIQTRFNKFRGYNKRNGKIRKYQAELPKHLHHRIDAMIARDMAAMLWSNKAKVPITPAVRGKLITIHVVIANPLYKWEMHIGHVILREAQFTSIGDVCLTVCVGGGGGRLS